jgi:Nickel responsive protein SCO4226-like
MPRFIAVHPITQTEKEWLELLKANADKFSQIPPGVSYNLSYAAFADGKVFCEWTAPNKEVVEQILKAMEAPTDAVYPVKLFRVSKMAFED